MKWCPTAVHSEQRPPSEPRTAVHREQRPPSEPRTAVHSEQRPPSEPRTAVHSEQRAPSDPRTAAHSEQRLASAPRRAVNRPRYAEHGRSQRTTAALSPDIPSNMASIITTPVHNVPTDVCRDTWRDKLGHVRHDLRDDRAEGGDARGHELRFLMGFQL